MARCEVCGNDYEMSFEVHASGAVHVVDSFEQLTGLGYRVTLDKVA